MLLSGKIMVVTGVANEKSIAWGIAKALHRQGAKLIFTYRREKSLRKLTKLVIEHGIEPLCIVPCDVLDDQSIEAAFNTIRDTTSCIHGIVHCIAYAEMEELRGNYVDITRDGYLAAQNSSAYSLVALAQHARHVMPNGGSIVAQSFIGAQRVVDNYNVMGVAKAALEASVRYLAYDLGEYGIRVNAISAGLIRTSASGAIENFDVMLSMIRERAPLRRNVDQDEVGDATMFLLSDLARGITGEVIFVDGGYHIVGRL